MPKVKSRWFLSFGLSIGLMGCAHVKPQTQYKQFSEIPETTEWQILYLKDFNSNNINYTHPSGDGKRLQDYSVVGTKNYTFDLFYLSDIPSCEGGGAWVSPAGEVGYTLLQGACTDLITTDGRVYEAHSFETLIERNLVGPILDKTTIWDLKGDRLTLKNSKNVRLAEFLRTK